MGARGIATFAGIVVLAVGCGRLGYASRDDVDSSTPSDVDAAPRDGAHIGDGGDAGDEPPGLAPVAPAISVSGPAAMARRPALVATATGWLVAWSDERDGAPDVFVATLDDAGNVSGSEVRLTNDDIASVSPSLASDGTSSVIAWIDDQTVRFQRLEEDASPLGSPVTVSAAVASDAVVARAGTGWLVIFDAGGELRATRLTTDGALIEMGAPLGMATDARRPDVTEGPDGVVVSWEDRRSGANEAYVQRFDSAGGALGAEGRITEDPASSQQTSIASGEASFGLAWENDSVSGDDIRFRLLDRAAAPILDEVLISGAVRSEKPVVVSHPAGYAVLFQSGDGTIADVWGAMVSARTAAASPGTQLSTGGGVDLAAAYDGSTIGVAYESGGSIRFLRVTAR